MNTMSIMVFRVTIAYPDGMEQTILLALPASLGTDAVEAWAAEVAHWDAGTVLGYRILDEGCFLDVDAVIKERDRRTKRD